VICASINNAILIAGDHVGYSYGPLVVTAYFVSIAVGYAYHCRITFDEPMNLSGYIRFSAGIWLGLPLSLLILAALSDGLNVPMWLAAPLMTGLMVAYHYAIARITIRHPSVH
jgi:putative flippase GtrA